MVVWAFPEGAWNLQIRLVESLELVDAAVCATAVILKDLTLDSLH